MDTKDFILEEYKNLCAERLQLREAYTRLERITFGGAVVVYGFLLINIEKITPWVWPAVPLLVVIAAARSFGFYFAINWKIDQYIIRIENSFYENFSGDLNGYQNTHEESRILWVPSRLVNVVLVNGLGWFAVLALTIAATVWRFEYYAPLKPICCE